MPGDLIASGVSDIAGRFSISIPADLVGGKLLLLRGTIDGVHIHAFLTSQQRGEVVVRLAAAQGSGAAAADSSIDPISNAAVQLLDDMGLENFSDDGVDAVIDAVVAATAGTAFDGLAIDQAVALAHSVAESDAGVQTALFVNQFTPTPSPAATPTATPVPCVGDCDSRGSVTVDEIITLVNIALGNAQPLACPEGIPSGAEVDVALIIRAVNNALDSCGDLGT